MSQNITLQEGEIVVSQNDFGMLVEEFVRNELRSGRNIVAEWFDARLREWWPLIEKYYQQHIITDIEVAIKLDEPPRYSRERLNSKEMWQKLVADLRPARSPYNNKYVCSVCHEDGIKLWRDYSVVASAVDLECAACLAPEVLVDDEGLWNDTHGRTDQLKGKVPAIPVDDTYWGYTSVPSQDIEWWKALPTYPLSSK